MNLLSILDNGGATYDRYTISLIDDNGGSACFGASDNPFHPMGFGQYVGDYCFPATDENPHIGLPVNRYSVPKAVEEYVTYLESDQ